MKAIDHYQTMFEGKRPSQCTCKKAANGESNMRRQHKPTFPIQGDIIDDPEQRTIIERENQGFYGTTPTQPWDIFFQLYNQLPTFFGQPFNEA